MTGGRPRQVRRPHWLAGNKAERFPHRWITWDTEAYRTRTKSGEAQQWRCGAATFWRDDLKTRDDYAQMTFTTPDELWDWVTEHCKAGTRTVAWCHNLAYDIRISNMLELLPKRGWVLDWCNLSDTVSTIVWRGGRGTLVFCDLFTWLPHPLSSIGGMVGRQKLPMPHMLDSEGEWQAYCMGDALVVQNAVQQLVGWLKDSHAGNWQPTGAGMMYTMWRHRFLDERILIHDDETALAAERAAMHTGRAEAWRHGVLDKDLWTEYDMRMAYCSIAADSDVPLKFKFHDRRVSNGTYRRLSLRYRCLARVRVRTTLPVVPVQVDGRTCWPVGEFETTLWDSEINVLLAWAQEVAILEMWRYTKGPALRKWGQWCLSVVGSEDDIVPLVVRHWVKHGSRALIGRLALRSRHWGPYGPNPLGSTGLGRGTDSDTGESFRVLHTSNAVLREHPPEEADSSCPQVTSWIMSECRARLWEAMWAAGLGNLAHVDTDSLIARQAPDGNSLGLLSADWAGDWRPKGSWRTIAVYGPRNYRLGAERRAAGVPRKASEPAPNSFTGERWESLSRALSEGSRGIVRVFDMSWMLRPVDRRRVPDVEDPTRTVAIQVGPEVCLGVADPVLCVGLDYAISQHFHGVKYPSRFGAPLAEFGVGVY